MGLANVDATLQVTFIDIYNDITQTNLRLQSSAMRLFLQQLGQTNNTIKHENSSLLALCDRNPPAIRLVGARPLSEPMLEYCLFDPEEQTPVTISPKFISSIQENAFETVVCEMANTLSRPQRDKHPLAFDE